MQLLLNRLRRRQDLLVVRERVADDEPVGASALVLLRRRMQRLFRRCLIAAGLTAGGVAVGEIILKAAARVIGVEMVSVGAGACLNEIVNR